MLADQVLVVLLAALAVLEQAELDRVVPARVAQAALVNQPIAQCAVR